MPRPREDYDVLSSCSRLLRGVISRRVLPDLFDHADALPSLLIAEPDMLRCVRIVLWLLLVGSAFSIPVSGQGPAAPPAALVVVAQAVEADVTDGRVYVGSVYPTQMALIGSAVDGRVIEFMVEAGDRVADGQSLAQLLTETISKEHEAAVAELAIRQSELLELENGSREQEVRQAKAMVNSRLAVLDYERQQLKRIEQLATGANPVVTDDQVQETVSRVSAAEAAWEDAEAAFQLVVEGPRPERIEQARARVLLQQAVCDRLLDQLQKHTIYSRFDGYVSAEHTERGAWVNRGGPVAEVIALDQVEIVLNVIEDQIPFVHLGDSVRIELSAVPDRIWTGKVSRIVPQADLRARTFPVKVLVENSIEDGVPVLKAGMLARGILATGPRVRATLVPKDALVLGGPQPQVYVVTPASIQPGRSGVSSQTGTVRSVPVALGVARDNHIQVTGAIRPGDLVVVRGNERIRPPAPGAEAPVTWTTETPAAVPSPATDSTAASS